MSSAWPGQEIFRLCHRRLMQPAPAGGGPEFSFPLPIGERPLRAAGGVFKKGPKPGVLAAQNRL
jgi:hypothetical protein